MKKGVFIFVVGLLAYVQSVLPTPTYSETVWLKDVTTRFQTDKRKHSDLDLPDQLTFHLSRGSNVLALNLKRNYDVDPNADIYVVQKLKDGRSFLSKTGNLEKEALAYYQDMENGAFITVRCVKRSNGQSDRVINGNIRIGDSNYDLRPAETDVTSRNFLEVQGLLGKRYVLQDQANIQRKISVVNTDAANASEQNVEEEYRALLRRFLHGQDKQSHLSRSDAKLSSLYNYMTKDKTRNLENVYYIEVAVLIDSGLWNIYSSMVPTADPLNKDTQVKMKIREAYSHIINGVNLRYKEISDINISISVTLAAFVFFQQAGQFPHKLSNLTIVDGKTYIEADDYLDDIYKWDEEIGANDLPNFDHAMLFTGYQLYKDSLNNRGGVGFSFVSGVCDVGNRTSVVMSRDYSQTMETATHELGHNLGADHDGEGNAIACKAEDLFIMSPRGRPANRIMPYSRNPWLFSNCSVEAFKKTLKDKQCVTNIGMFYNMDEWTTYMKKQPGDVFTPTEQCRLLKGPSSVYCGRGRAEVCHLIRCTDPRTGRCQKKLYNGARGTNCGENMWCIEGRCVPERCNETNDVL